MSFTVRRPEMPQERFTIFTNDFVRGKLPVPIKAVARCLLQYFLSLPDGWRCDRPQLDRSMMEGHDAVSTGLDQLEAAGYLRREKHRDNRGRWVWSWHITHDPIEFPLPPSPENPLMEPTSKKATKLQVAPYGGNPSTGNPPILEEPVKKTDPKKIDRTSSGGIRVAARASAGQPQKPLVAQALINKPAGYVAQKLTGLWSALVVEQGGCLPERGTNAWENDGDRSSYLPHPAGNQMKAFLLEDPQRLQNLESLEMLIDWVHKHASHRAVTHPAPIEEAA